MNTAQEIKLRLKAPMVVAKRISEGRYVPKVFGQAIMGELRKIQRMAVKLGKTTK